MLASKADMLRGIRSIRFIGALTFLGIALGVATPASAAQTEQACMDALLQIEDARSALDGLQAAVDNAKADRETLTSRVAELDAEIAYAIGDKKTIAKLRAERARVTGEIETIDTLLPPIEQQRDVLAAEVEQVERGYIACVEATL